MQRSPLKVLLLQDTTNYAGTEAHVLTLAKNLAKHTDVSAIVGVTAGGELHMRCAAGNIPYRVLPKTPGMFNLAGIIAVAKMLRDRDVDVIHAHNGRTSLVAVCAKLHIRKGRVVLTQHFIEPDYVNRKGLGGKLVGMIHGFILTNVDQHICISEAVKSAFIDRQESGVNDFASVHIVQNGIDDVYRSLERAECREKLFLELKLPLEARIVLCVARLEPEKDVQALITAVSAIKTSSPFHCLIVGDGNERNQLEGFVRDTNIKDRVLFLGFRDDVPAIMKSADIFVLPAPAEPFGLVVVEAMLARLPVVAINNGGPAEIMINEQTGFLVSRGDVNAMGKAITTLLENPTIRQSMGINGQQRAESVYSSSTMSINTSNVYAICASE
jgi:glycosyltransferase involved in cell wall biosynthesis